MKKEDVNFVLILAFLVVLASSGFAQTDFWEQTKGPVGMINEVVVNSQGDIFAVA